MRNKQEFKLVNIRKEIYDRLIEDRKHFQAVIGGGVWSISDVITEYLKMLPPRQ